MALSLFNKAVCLALAVVLFVNASAQDTAAATRLPQDSLLQVMEHRIEKHAAGTFLQPLQQEARSLAKEPASVIHPLKEKIRFLKASKPFEVKDALLDASYQYTNDTSENSKGLYGGAKALYNVRFTSSIALWSLPFRLDFSSAYGMLATDYRSFSRFYQANFDPKQYRELLQKQVLEKIKPEQVTASVTRRIDAIRENYEKQLLQEIRQVQDELLRETKTTLGLPEHLASLSFSDFSSLKTTLLPEQAVESYQQSLARYQELIRNKTGPLDDSSAITGTLLTTIKRFEALERIEKKIVAYKEKYEQNAVVKEMRSHLPFTSGSFRSYLSKPGNLQQIIKEHADINGIQKLFLSITKLDLGKNPVETGELSLQHLVNTGIHTELKSRKAGFGFIQGINDNANQWLQTGLQRFVTNEYSGLTGFSFGSGTQSVTSQQVAFQFFNFRNSPEQFDPLSRLQGTYLPMVQHRDAVLTWQSSLPIGAHNQVKLNVSKSFGSFRNGTDQKGDGRSGDGFASLFSNQGKDNFAATIDYEGEIWQTPLHLFVKTVGLGYNNPGNVFLRRGEKEAVLTVSKRLLQQKLSFKYATSYREQHFDVAKQFTYTSFSNKLQASYRIRRNNRFGISWQQSHYVSRLSAPLQARGTNNILQADGSYRFFISGRPVMNNAALTHQTIALPGIGSTYASKSWLWMHSSSVLLHKNLLSATFVMNRSSNNEYYFTTSFVNAEVNYNCALPGTIQWTSGGGFYSNPGWNKQVGVRQQLSAVWRKRFTVDLDVNYKRAVQVTRPELANQLFITTALHYQLY